jgi:hypothetical protein
MSYSCLSTTRQGMEEPWKHRGVGPRCRSGWRGGRGARGSGPQKPEQACSGDDYWNLCAPLVPPRLDVIGRPNCGVNQLCDTSDFLGFPDTWVLQKSQMAFESEGLAQGWDAKEEMGNSHNDGSREHETFTQVSLCTPSEAGCRKLKRIYLRAGPTSRSPATTRTDSNLKARVSGGRFLQLLSVVSFIALSDPLKGDE